MTLDVWSEVGVKDRASDVPIRTHIRARTLREVNSRLQSSFVDGHQFTDIIITKRAISCQSDLVQIRRACHQCTILRSNARPSAATHPLQQLLRVLHRRITQLTPTPFRRRVESCPLSIPSIFYSQVC